jgi:dihydrodipicolinate reductase
LGFLNEIKKNTQLSCHFSGAHVQGFRLGHLPPEHQIIIGGAHESIRLTHQVFDRLLYIKEAFEAVKWIMNQKSGLYSVKDWIDSE